MRIPYVTKSRFMAPLVHAIREQGERLDSGQPVRVDLGPRGYEGVVRVIVGDVHHRDFGTDWAGKDWTRFPARIRAAASALDVCGMRGAFEISHEDGRLSIQRAPDEAVG